MKFVILMCILVSSTAFAAWTNPHGTTPVKEKVVKEETRNPASAQPIADKSQTKSK